MKTGTRNSCIDTIKGFACIAVVLIHYNWGNTLSTILQVIGRFAVPFFFFVAGFYLPDHNSNVTSERTFQKAKHIGIILLKSVLFYAPFCIVWNLAMDSSWDMLSFTQDKITLGSIIKVILSSDPIVYSHLWYLLASFSCYLLLSLIGKYLKQKNCIFLFLTLSLLYISFAELREISGFQNYYPLPDGKTLVISNLFLLRALPFVVYGIFLRKKCTPHSRLSFVFLLAVCLLGFICAVIEHFHYGTVLMYIGTFFSVIAMSLIACNYPNKRIGIMEYIGSRLSMYVYIYHIAVGKIMDLLYAKLHLWGKSPFKFLRPILVLLGSVAVAQLIVFFKRKLQLKKSCS